MECRRRNRNLSACFRVAGEVIAGAFWSMVQPKGPNAYSLARSHDVIGAAIEVHRVLGPGLLVVEVKAIERIMPIHRMQLLSSLRLQGAWLGLLINFNVEVLRDGIRRVLNG
jgi:hypothetical protein